MGLLQQAVATYDNMTHLAGVSKEGHIPLSPVSHIMQNAQIEVTLDRSGNIVSVQEVDITDCKTIIPATEMSAGRTSNIAAHPFSDQLEYLLPVILDKHNDYVAELCQWESSDFSHPKVTAVRKCIESGKLASALVEAGLLPKFTESGFPAGKLAKRDYAKCLVRWRVPNTGEHDDAWRDRSLMDAFAAYYMARQSNRVQGICMISGEKDTIASNHPKGITAANYGAKLISAKDNDGFTYRGRFAESWQAATIGYTASQKAHCALQWIAADQGVICGGRTFLCWNPNGVQVHQAITPLSFGNENKPLEPTEYRAALAKALYGLQNALPAFSKVIVCAFDAATTGRLSLTYYNELYSSDFYQRIKRWYETCCWENGPFGIQSPSIAKIVEYAFGKEISTGGIEIDDKLKREQNQRMMTCIIDRMPIPYDIVVALFRRTSTPMAYSTSKRAGLLFTACAVIRKYLNDKYGKEEWSMAFEPQKADRSYQFGCLLAVMEKVERDTYDKDENREPNAIQLQSVFCEHPLHTAYLLNKKLEPYFARLLRINKASYFYYKRRLGEILEIISSFAEEQQNRPLKETYLLGYYLQRKELYTAHSDRVENAEMEDK